jgi:hypothetical protein
MFVLFSDIYQDYLRSFRQVFLVRKSINHIKPEFTIGMYVPNI